MVALIAFMPTKADGALGSLEYTKEERHAFAIKSREAPPKFGNGERQKLIDEVLTKRKFIILNTIFCSHSFIFAEIFFFLYHLLPLNGCRFTNIC